MHISNRVHSKKTRTITDLKETIREEMRAIPQSVCKNVIDSFVRRVKKCTELNGDHLVHTLYSTQEQADRQRVLAIYLEHNKLTVSEFSFNLNGNLRNDEHRKLGPVFFGSPCM